LQGSTGVFETEQAKINMIIIIIKLNSGYSTNKILFFILLKYKINIFQYKMYISLFYVSPKIKKWKGE